MKEVSKVLMSFSKSVDDGKQPKTFGFDLSILQFLIFNFLTFLALL